MLPKGKGKYRKIRLGNRLGNKVYALVTTEDFIKYGGFRWGYCKDYMGNLRACRSIHSPKRAVIYLHREILGLQYGDPRQGDHINHDTLNNIHTDDPSTNNLRIATAKQNKQNSRRYKRSNDLPKGVYPYNNSGQFKSTITANGRVIPLGVYATPGLARKAYIEAAKKFHKEFFHP